MFPSPKQRTEKRSKCSGNHSLWPILPGNKQYLVFSFIFVASRTLSICENSFLSEGFCWVWSLWKQLWWLCFSRDNETCRRTQHQRGASTGSCQCTVWSLIKQNRRSCDSQKDLSGLRDVRQEHEKSSGLCEKVWYRWTPWQTGKAGREEILWMTQNSLA